MKTPLAYTQTHTDTHTLNLDEFDKVGHKRKQHNKNRERDTPSTNDLLNILLRETSARKRLHCGSNVSSVNINIWECVMSGLLYWLRRITIRNMFILSLSIIPWNDVEGYMYYTFMNKRTQQLFIFWVQFSF